MTFMAQLMTHASMDAMYVAKHADRQVHVHLGIPALQHVDGCSLLGHHNGVFDDDLMADLRSELA